MDRTALLRPQYVDRLPLCNIACPAGENIQEWLALAQTQRFEEAWRALVKNNPMPAIHGRVCYHPCENACNRKRVDQAVNIHGIERFLGDLAIENGWKIRPGTPTGRMVLVIGSGPCGLSAAYHLARIGHRVTVYEAGQKLGGMMRYGIPEYRLPRAVLDAEINRIARMGVDFQTNTKAENLDAFVKDHKFDAVFLAIGAQLSKRVDIPSTDAGRIVDALNFLANPQENTPLCLGRRVAVYGGGNTAMDAARTALRLGAAESLIIYRRDRARMPAHQSELDEATAEGVVVNWLRTIKHFGTETIEVEVMKLDAKGRPEPTGQIETINADMLVLALGQETQSQFLKDVPGLVVNSDGTIEVDAHMMTGHAGIFAGGDMIPQQKTVTIAVGHGKKAARNIDAWLTGREYKACAKNPAARFDLLNVENCFQAPRHEPDELEPQTRIESFDETVGGLNEPDAFEESRRCLSCGTCSRCDTCLSQCPDGAIIRGGWDRPYQVDLDMCSRCGLCAQNCPCGAMAMVADR
jgi:formate dehydrogenase (NADP+) beta subunit